MNPEMSSECVEIVSSAVDKYLVVENYEKASQAAKESLERKFGPTWNVCVGEGFGYDVTYNAKHCLLVYYGEFLVLWKFYLFLSLSQTPLIPTLLQVKNLGYSFSRHKSQVKIHRFHASNADSSHSFTLNNDGFKSRKILRAHCFTGSSTRFTYNFSPRPQGRFVIYTDI